jgi:glycosyltransferase involved in cell wall biosynthesis
MAHLPHFLSEVGKYCDIHVIIQRSKGKPEIPNVRSVNVQRPGNHFKRAIELIRIAYGLHLQGCRKFFVRISASAALELGLISRFLKLQVYYWVSGQGKNIKSPWLKGFLRRIYCELCDCLLRFNIRLAHRLVTGPESMVDYFIKEYGADPDKIIVLYNDVNTAAIKPLSIFDSKESLRQKIGLPISSPILLLVGRISPFKGGHYLIPIARLFRERMSDALVVIVGPIQMPQVVELARQQGLCNLHFVGPIPNTLVTQYYHAADVFIIPSESEGFPRVVVEAMACGLPIVTFDVGGVKDILAPEQLKFVVPRGNLENLVDKAVILLKNPVLRAEQAKIGRIRVKRYSTKRVAQMFIDRIVLE